MTIVLQSIRERNRPICSIPELPRLGGIRGGLKLGADVLAVRTIAQTQVRLHGAAVLHPEIDVARSSSRHRVTGRCALSHRSSRTGSGAFAELDNRVLPQPARHDCDLPDTLAAGHAMILAERAARLAAEAHAEEAALLRLKIERLNLLLAKTRRRHLGQSARASRR